MSTYPIVLVYTGKCIELKMVAFYSTLTVMNMRKYMNKSVWVKSYQDDYEPDLSGFLRLYSRKYLEPKYFNRSLFEFLSIVYSPEVFVVKLS